jgi:thioredoxin-like negative regulator of GroEL
VKRPEIIVATMGTMATTTRPTTTAPTMTKPGLVFFHSSVSGKCRRIEGYIAQVLQRRRNHETFKYYSVAQEQRPDLVEKFGVRLMPTLVVVENRAVRARLEEPRGCREIESFLAPWLN